MAFRMLLPVMLCLAPQMAFARSGGTAHLYAYSVKDRAAFERGYRRHLDWHGRAGDVLVWYGWYVVAGERAGAFVDGTFGTTPEALAGRPDTSGDAADFRSEVAPFATAIGDERWEFWPEASTADTLERRRPNTRIAVYVIEPRDVAALETAVRDHRSDGIAWYRSDGDRPRYLLMAAAKGSKADIRLLLGENHPALGYADVVRAEIWDYVPHLTRIPPPAG